MMMMTTGAGECTRLSYLFPTQALAHCTACFAVTDCQKACSLSVQKTVQKTNQKNWETLGEDKPGKTEKEH
jgi:hypothetical protein